MTLAERRKGRLEVHSHTFVSGPRANGPFVAATQRTTSTFDHSHEGGDVPHTHPDTGPACYVIDKDEWARLGYVGGGRKKFTAQPTGEQMPAEPLSEEERTFDVVVCDPPPGFEGTGGGEIAAHRMMQAFGLKPRVINGRKERA